jgi:O-acetyl-ADP-ribose deacetylase (regulator of RNase III)
VRSDRITLVQGDITHQEVDAIVNAANTSLLGGGGVDGAIHRAAGPDLLKECRALGGCETGEAKITKGYHLPAKFVIHTPGPVWRGTPSPHPSPIGEFSGGGGEESGGREEDRLLANCYRNSLALAVQHNLRTIAFPSISTGIYGFPIERAARIAVREVKNFLERHPDFEKVVFVTFSQRDYTVYQSVIREIIGA